MTHIMVSTQAEIILAGNNNYHNVGILHDDTRVFVTKLWYLHHRGGRQIIIIRLQPASFFLPYYSADFIDLSQSSRRLHAAVIKWIIVWLTG